jgi:hypothetical protein
VESLHVSDHPRPFGVNDGLSIQKGRVRSIFPSFSLPLNFFERHPSYSNSAYTYQYERPIGQFSNCMGFWRFLCGGICVFWGSGIIYYRAGWRWTLFGIGLLLVAGFLWTYGREDCEDNYSEHYQSIPHDSNSIAYPPDE